MKLLRVKNWGEFQHYKHRSPPWIKLHRELLNDFAFQSLTDAGRAHLMLIWVLAAGTEGVVPASPKFIASRIGATSTVDLDAIIAAGFLIPEEGAEIPEAPLAHKANGGKPVITDSGEIIERIPMIGGEEFEVKTSFVCELERLYPAVDVPATLKQMRGWCIGNPTKLKTPRGIRKFITGWCERDQNG